MVIGSLDTAIVVDLLRQYTPAQAWLNQLPRNDRLGVSPIVWLEVIDGVSNRQEQNTAIKLLGSFEWLDLTPDDCRWAVNQAIKFKLSHNTDIEDCLIASTSHRLQIPLFTANIKHFQPLIGPLAQKPY
jgi:predicted nucleic acid-binding protein